jgi:hypothetical protein
LVRLSGEILKRVRVRLWRLKKEKKGSQRLPDRKLERNWDKNRERVNGVTRREGSSV